MSACLLFPAGSEHPSSLTWPIAGPHYWPPHFPAFLSAVCSPQWQPLLKHSSTSHTKGKSRLPTGPRDTARSPPSGHVLPQSVLNPLGCSPVVPLSALCPVHHGVPHWGLDVHCLLCPCSFLTLWLHVLLNSPQIISLEGTSRLSLPSCPPTRVIPHTPLPGLTSKSPSVVSPCFLYGSLVASL